MKLEDEEEEDEVEEENSGNDSTNTGTSEKVKFYVLCVLDSKQAIWCPCSILQDADNAGSITYLLAEAACIIVVSFPHVRCSVFLQLSM